LKFVGYLKPIRADLTLVAKEHLSK